MSSRLPRAFLRPLLLSAVLLAGCAADTGGDAFPRLTGPYLGQTPPGAEPEPFAPGIVASGLSVRDMAMTPDGREMYWTCSVGSFAFCAILGARQREDGSWTEPEVVPFAADPASREFEPFVTPDGRRFFFVSDRPADDTGNPAGSEDIWYAEREGDGWGEPVNLGAPVNGPTGEYFPSLTRDGTLYFTRQLPGTGENVIMRSRPVDGGWSEPERLPDEVNAGRARYNAFVAPDESYLILTVFGLPDTRGSADYYICFRDEDDAWSSPVNLGDTINTASGREHAPYLSPDGRFFFFMRSSAGTPQELGFETLTRRTLQRLHGESRNGSSDTWWVDAAFLQELRPRG
jgi:hypothetical protein